MLCSSLFLGCVNQLFLISPSHHGRAVGKMRTMNSVSSQKIHTRKSIRSIWALKELCKVTTPAPTSERAIFPDRGDTSILPTATPLSALFLITSQQNPRSPSHLWTFPKWCLVGTPAFLGGIPCRTQRGWDTAMALCLWDSGSLL